MSSVTSQPTLFPLDSAPATPAPAPLTLDQLRAEIQASTTKLYNEAINRFADDATAALNFSQRISAVATQILMDPGLTDEQRRAEFAKLSNTFQTAKELVAIQSNNQLWAGIEHGLRIANAAVATIGPIAVRAAIGGLTGFIPKPAQA